jgi:putative methionine-R-sulfoxide reductase with GAF domain
VRVCEGAVEPGAALALGDAERAQGHVLACTARATSDVLVDVSREG